MPHKPLSFGQNGQSNQIAKGIYIDAVKIIQVRDVSGKKPAQFLHSLKNVAQDKLSDLSKTPVDLGIEVKLDIGRDFEPVMSFYGWFSREGNTVTGWGGAFKVRALFDAVHVKGDLDVNNRIPAEAVKQLVGKTFLRLTYVRGLKPNSEGPSKLAYATWDVVGAYDEKDPEGSKKALLAKFQKSLAKGYPKNFKPETVDQVQDASATFTPPTDEQPTVAQAKTEEDPW